MLHVTRLTTGLQDLLCEGRFVDVRICCSDHSPSDGLGAHRAMLAAASPGLGKAVLRFETSLVAREKEPGLSVRLHAGHDQGVVKDVALMVVPGDPVRSE